MRFLLLILGMATAVFANAETAASLFERAQQETDPTQKIKLLSGVIEQSPKHVGAYHNRADAYLSLHHYPQAIKDYNRVVALRPKDPFRYYARALAYNKMKQPSLALADFSKAISLKPDYKNFYLERARTYAVLGKYGPSLEDYKTYAASLSNQPVPLLREMVPVSIGAYRFDEAETLLSALQAQGEDSAQFYTWQGRVLQNAGQLDEAVSAYSRAVNREPEDPQAYRMRGNAFKELKDYEAALEDYTRSLELEPEAYWFNRRGLTYEETKQFEQALQDYNKAVELDPRWGVAYNNRGYAKMYLKDFAGAKTDFETAIKLDSQSPSPYVNLAGLYWTAKRDRKKMYEYLQKAIQHNFKNTESLYDDEQKGWLFKNINKTAEFRSLFYK